MAETQTDEKPAETEVDGAKPSPEAQTAGVETAQEGATPAQVQQAVEKEDKEQRPEVTQAERKAQAAAFVDELEARGIIEAPDANPPAPPAPATPAPEASSPTPSDSPSEATGPSGDDKPARRSFADWFFGNK